jgi:hypothetical protein
MRGWSLNDLYDLLWIYSLGTVILLAFILYLDAKERREAQGHRGWFSRPTITRCTWQKLGAILIVLSGFAIMALGLVATGKGWTDMLYVGFLVGLVVASVGHSLWDIITEDERRDRADYCWRRRFDDSNQERDR